jgi:hypothetical protein
VLWSPHDETHLPAPERAARFAHWVSAYYAHPCAALAAHDPALLDCASLPYPTPPTSAYERAPSVCAMSDAERANVVYEGAEASERVLLRLPRELLVENACRAFFDEGARERWPACRFVLVWSARGTSTAVAAAWAVERMYKESEGRGKEMKVVELPWANQFVRTSPGFRHRTAGP